MTIATAPVRCHRCRRYVLRSEPLWMLGQPYGPSCGRRYGLTPTRRARVRVPDRAWMGEEGVLEGLAELLAETETDNDKE